MNNLETYLLLFFDSFLDTVVIPIHQPYAYTVLSHFGDYPLLSITIVTICGYAAGITINTIIGRIITRIPVKRDKGKTESYEMIKRYAKSYGFLAFLAIGWISSVTTLISIAAGIFHMRISVVALSTAASISGYYVYTLLIAS